MQCRVKVVKAKQRPYNDLYPSKGGDTDLYRLVKQRDEDGMDMQQARVIKDGDGDVFTDARSATGRCRRVL